MIDPECPIWKAGHGFCWAPSAAWGCSDQELCTKCQAKPRAEYQPVRVRVVKPSQMPSGSILIGPSPELHSERTCRFCGQKNVYPKQWRAKDRMCRKRECWAKFVEELKLAV